MKNTLKHIMLTALLAGVPAFAEDAPDCSGVSNTVTAEISATPLEVINIVDRLVTSNSSCACEVVKSAIVGTKADSTEVRAIVEVAINAAPEQMDLIAQCAIAVAPDALEEVQAVLAKYDPQSGVSYSAKGGYSAKGKEPIPAPRPPAISPLDGPYLTPGGDLPYHPPIVLPNDITQVSDFFNR